MGGKNIDLFCPPFEYERQKTFEQVKKEVMNSFWERIKNTIDEKRKYCLENGLSLDVANFIITKAIQNLYSLVPLATEQIDIEELVLNKNTKLPLPKFPSFPPKDEDVPENGFSL